MKHIDVIGMTHVRQPEFITVKLLLESGYRPELVYEEKDEAIVLEWLAWVKRAAGVEAMRENGIEPIPGRKGERGGGEPRSFKGKLQPGRCAYCHQQSDNLTRDHIIPVSKGGTDDPDNIVSACQSCNSKKHNASLIEFVARGGIS